MNKLINLDRLSEFYDLLKERAAYALSNDNFTVRLSGGFGNSSIALPVYFDTTNGWAGKSNLISATNAIYVYTDYRIDSHGNYIPGIKIGDGNSYLIDMPFMDSDYLEHINNNTIHVTQADKDRWNGKVNCTIDTVDSQMLVFSTD